MSRKIEKRKEDHIRICVEKNVQVKNITNGFEDIYFIHKALPEIEKEKINTKTKVFEHTFTAPIIVGALTGGTPKAAKINAAIAEAVEKLGLGMGVGSQRAAIENANLKNTFSIVRKKAPEAFIIANIGAPQLVRGYSVKEVRQAIEMINANALAIHLNALQEAIQPEGETSFAKVLEKIEALSESLDLPVIVKETGAGIAAEEAKKLESAGVDGIDIAGTGGTSWAAVEYYRAKEIGNAFLERLGEVFWDWGIPTAISLIEVAQSVHIPIIASGGMRSGIHVAKALALGASLASFSSPILHSALKGTKEVEKLLSFYIAELKNVMFLTGTSNIQELSKVPLVITGKTAEWLKIRGFKPEVYARRERDLT